MIQFANADAKAPLKGRNQLKKVLRELFISEGKLLTSLQYIFCSDEYLLKINRDFLAHDYYTDIITFEMAEDPGKGIEGEIYISVDRVKENAEEFRRPPMEELQRVIFHGALHLCGYGDKTEKQVEQMREKEDEYLAKVSQGTVSPGNTSRTL